MTVNPMKIKPLFHLRNLTVLMIVNLIFILTIFNNDYGQGFWDLSELLNVTLVNLLLFVPVCVFLICLFFHDSTAYQIRFESKAKWLHNESNIIMIVLVGYTVCHVGIACLSVVTANLIRYGHIDVTPAMICGILFYFLSQWLFVAMIFFIMLSLYLSLIPEMAKCGFIAVIIITLLYLAEIVTSRNGFITPAMRLDLSFSEHIIRLMPRFLLLLLTVAVYQYVANERSLYVKAMVHCHAAKL